MCSDIQTPTPGQRAVAPPPERGALKRGMQAGNQRPRCGCGHRGLPRRAHQWRAPSLRSITVVDRLISSTCARRAATCEEHWVRVGYAAACPCTCRPRAAHRAGARLRSAAHASTECGALQPPQGAWRGGLAEAGRAGVRRPAWGLARAGQSGGAGGAGARASTRPVAGRTVNTPVPGAPAGPSMSRQSPAPRGTQTASKPAQRAAARLRRCPKPAVHSSGGWCSVPRVLSATSRCSAASAPLVRPGLAARAHPRQRGEP